jgi:hypothetical protein
MSDPKEIARSLPANRYRPCPGVNDSLHLDACQAREDIKAGLLRGPALAQRLLAVPPADRDVWADALLGLPEPPPDVPDLPSGAVPYLPAGIEEILTLVREAPLRPDDTLVDLGSGMGRVVMLAHLLSGARARGVEIQRPLVDCARVCSDRMGLRDLQFIHANAAEVGQDGSIFFLYAPFGGETLATVLRGLERLAHARPLVVCTVGLELPASPWLSARKTSCLSMTMYDSRLRHNPPVVVSHSP